MIDRVNLRAYVPSAQAVLDRLPPPSRVSLPDGSIIWRGELGPFGYSLRDDTLRLRGSLSRYAEGATPPRVAALATQRLSDVLGFDVGTAKVTRVEVFADLALAHPVCLYLPLLWALGRHKRLTVQDPRGSGETLKFITHRRSYQIYDKGTQAGLHTSGGLARAELSYRNGGVASHFGRGLTLSDVAEKLFRRHVAEQWHGWYEKVEKGRELRTDLGARDFFRALSVERIHDRGVGNVLAEIAAHRAAGVISNSTASDRRRDVLSITRNPKFTSPSPLLAELDEHVTQAARRMVG